MLYPLKFYPIFKDKIWGGENIRTILKKNFSPLVNCGESWEISGIRQDESIVSNGSLAGISLNGIISEFTVRLLGRRIYERFKGEFPLLIKFIDANQDLSIQVHPNDSLALQRHNSFGKTEMWYIIHADEQAELISGFNQDMDKIKYLHHVNKGTLLEVLNREKVQDDDVFFIPAGRIHTIGKGLLLAEIQQSSDVTYRIYDFERKDENNNQRELHIEDSIDAIDYAYHSDYKIHYTNKVNQPVEIVHSPYFTTNKILLSQKLERDMSALDSFVIYICLEGKGSILYGKERTPFQLGEVLLVPAELTNYTIVADTRLKLLETYISK